jgi:hypothetical protein
LSEHPGSAPAQARADAEARLAPETIEPKTREGVAAAIYGSILVTALVGGLNEGDVSAGVTAATVVVTTAVFWLAHVWSQLLADRIATGSRLYWGHIRTLAAREWPMIEAGAVPVLALVPAWIGVYRDEIGVDLALTLAVLQLVGWGIVGARRLHAAWHVALLAGLVDGALGLAIVALEIAIH